MKRKEDIKIQKLFERDIPQPGTHQWFRQKIINRLPPRRRKALSGIERVAYIAGIFAIIAFMAVRAFGIVESKTVTVADIATYATATALLIGIVWSIVSARIAGDV